MAWLPDSLITKLRYGFRADSKIEDGSICSTRIIEELALCDGELKDKIYTLYACGVTGYEGKVFSPKQLVSMVVHRDPYQVGQVCQWIGGIRTESGIVYGPSPENKQALFEHLCGTLDEWTPLKFRSIPHDVIETLRIRLKLTPEAISDYALSVYAVADYAQFIFLLIHPFWNRNGRTSEEAMHLFCLSNSAGKRVFWQDASQRYNHATSTRMELINKLALNQLTEILKKLGVDTDPSLAVTTGYKQCFSQEANICSRTVLTYLSPYLYRFVAQRLASKQLKHYFECLEDEIGEMISKLSPESFCKLSEDETTLKLLEHHLTNTAC